MTPGNTGFQSKTNICRLRMWEFLKVVVKEYYISFCKRWILSDNAGTGYKCTYIYNGNCAVHLCIFHRSSSTEHWLAIFASVNTHVHTCVYTYVHIINLFHHIHKRNVLLWGRRWWLHRLRRRGLCDCRRGTASWLWHCGLHWCGGGRLSAGPLEGTHFEANGKAIDIPTRPGMHMLRQGYTRKWICTHKRTPYTHAHRKT